MIKSLSNILAWACHVFKKPLRELNSRVVPPEEAPFTTVASKFVLAWLLCNEVLAWLIDISSDSKNETFKLLMFAHKAISPFLAVGLVYIAWFVKTARSSHGCRESVHAVLKRQKGLYYRFLDHDRDRGQLRRVI